MSPQWKQARESNLQGSISRDLHFVFITINTCIEELNIISDVQSEVFAMTWSTEVDFILDPVSGFASGGSQLTGRYLAHINVQHIPSHKTSNLICPLAQLLRTLSLTQKGISAAKHPVGCKSVHQAHRLIQCRYF